MEQAIGYEIDGRQCEGMLVCDDRLKKTQSRHSSALRLEGHLHRNHRPGAHDRGRGIYDATLDRRSNALVQEFLAETLK